MNPAFKRYLDAATDLTELTAARAERVVRQLVRSGEAAGDQVGELVDDLLERQRRNREQVTSLVRTESVRAMRSMGLATGSEVERLQRQVADLKREMAGLRAQLVAAGATGSPTRAARRSPAKKAATRTAAKKATAKKATAKKATAKKATAKKATAKRSGTRGGTS